VERSTTWEQPGPPSSRIPLRFIPFTLARDRQGTAAKRKAMGYEADAFAQLSSSTGMAARSRAAASAAIRPTTP